MTDAHPQHGPSSIAALATDDPSFEAGDGPYKVHGIALGEGDTTQGVSGDRVRWPRESLEDAAAKLVGKKLTDGRNHETLEQSQPPTSAIIGEVTDAAYEPGVGIVYEGEVDSPDIARLIHRDRVDVSPVIAYAASEGDGDVDVVAEEIEAFRDLAVVAEGAAPSNDISPGAAPDSVTAAAMAGLQATFADTADDEAVAAAMAATTGDDGADGDTPQSTGGQDAPTGNHSDTTDMNQDDITDSERELLAAVNDPEAAIEVLQKYKGREEPRIVEQDELEALEAENREVREALAMQLTDDEFAAEAMAKQHDAAALKEQVAGDDESLGEALQQTPETGSADEADGQEALGDADQDEVETLTEQIDAFERRGWDAAAETKRERLAELTGQDPDELEV